MPICWNNNKISLDLDMDNLPQVENVFSSSTEKIIILDKNNKTDPFGIM
jgi:hypothetical protein